jgi:hypothetical protein
VSLISGVTSGVLGLTGLFGFFPFFISSFLTSIYLYFLINKNLYKNLTSSSVLLTGGFFQGFMV